MLYDLNKIKAIPCADIAVKYGISLVEKHGRLWGKLRRDEKTSSFSIRTDKNLWYDFGAHKGGSVIDLLAEIKGISPTEAINKLAADYGLDKNEHSSEWSPLTDNQYRQIGIQPERATANFNFDLNKHSELQLSRWSEKYGMPVQILASEFPDIYNKMVIKIAQDNINTHREAYYSRLQEYKKSDINDITKGFLKSCSKDDAKTINDMVDLLNRAVTNGINFNRLKVNFEMDFESVLHNKNTDTDLSEDAALKERYIKIYTNNLKYSPIKYFDIEQVKALRDVNRIISNSDNMFLPIDSIKRAYSFFGNSLDKLNNDFIELCNTLSKLPKNNPDYVLNECKFSNMQKQISRVKDIFDKFNIVVDAVKTADLSFKNDLLKENIRVNAIRNCGEISL